jgi:hypothetical protein
MLKKNKYIVFVFIVLLFLIIIIVVLHFTGHINRFDNSYQEPISISEIFENFPGYLAVSVIASTLLTRFLIIAEEQKEKDREEALKRIEAKKKDKHKENLK